MIVLDASAAVHLLLETPQGDEVADRLSGIESVNVPAHFDFEVLSTIRKLTLRGLVPDRDAIVALEDLGALPLRRWPAREHLDRAFEMRHAVGAGDALYLALGEALDAPIVTFDARLKGSNGHCATIELL